MEPKPPPPPLPPPPPASRPEDEERAALGARRRRADLREILALFHAEGASAGAWGELWAATLAEAQEDQRRQRLDKKRKRRPGEREPPAPPGRRPGPPPSDGKRPRPPSATDSEPSKLGRPGRFQAKGAGGPKGSKLMQKLGGGARG